MLVLMGALTACVSNPINAKTGQRYAEEGLRAEQAGNLALARENYHRAYVNARLGRLGPASEAFPRYEWSRVTGYLGACVEAENGLNEVLTLIDKAQGGADRLRPPALSELARLLHDTGQHAKAVLVYEQAAPVLEEAGILKTDPIAFADLLDDYAASLRAAGRAPGAAEISDRAVAIREANKGLTAKFKARRYQAASTGANAR